MDSIPDKAAPAPVRAAASPRGHGGGMPKGSLRVGLLAYLAALASLYTLYFAREIFIPFFLAVLLKMLLAPLMRLITRLHIPHGIAALLVVLMLVGCVGGIGYAIEQPAQRWFHRAPHELPKLRARLHDLLDPLHQVQQATRQVEQAAQADQQDRAVVVRQPGLSDYLFSGTRSVLTAIATVLLLLYALLAAGDHFLRRVVESLPRFSEKRHAVEVAHQVEHDISRYLLTITAINFTMGCVAWAIGAATGLPNPLLWGVLAGTLNYIPYLGPLTAVSTLSFIGLMTYTPIGQALLPAAIYGGATLIEGNLLTPLVLSRRLQINAVCVFVGLMLFAFIWGVPGMLLAVPLLAMLRIVCDHIEPLAPIGRLLGDGRNGGSDVPSHDTFQQRNGVAKKV